VMSWGSWYPYSKSPDRLPSRAGGFASRGDPCDTTNPARRGYVKFSGYAIMPSPHPQLTPRHYQVASSRSHRPPDK
jgi:hypothetical protein